MANTPLTCTHRDESENVLGGFQDVERQGYTGVDYMYNHVHCVCEREVRQLGVKVE